MFRNGVRLPSVVASGRSRRFPIVPVVSIALGRCVGLVSSARRPMFSLQIGCRDVHGITHTNHTGCVCVHIFVLVFVLVLVLVSVSVLILVPVPVPVLVPMSAWSSRSLSLNVYRIRIVCVARRQCPCGRLVQLLHHSWVLYRIGRTQHCQHRPVHPSIHTYVCPHVPMYVHAQMYIPTICYVQTYHVPHWFGWYGGWCCGMTRKTKRGTTAGYRHVETDRVSHDCFGI